MVCLVEIFYREAKKLVWKKRGQERKIKKMYINEEQIETSANSTMRGQLRLNSAWMETVQVTE